MSQLDPQPLVEEDNKSIFEMDLPNETESQEQPEELQEQIPPDGITVMQPPNQLSPPEEQKESTPLPKSHHDSILETVQPTEERKVEGQQD